MGSQLSKEKKVAFLEPKFFCCFFQENIPFRKGFIVKQSKHESQKLSPLITNGAKEYGDLNRLDHL